MENMRTLLFTACSTLIVGEIIYYLTPKDKLTDCIYALFYTVIILTAVLNFTNFEFDFSQYTNINPQQEKIDEKISEYYIFETEKEMKKMIEEALDVIHIPCKDIVTKIEKNGDVIEIYSIKISLYHKSDIQNAKAVVNALFSNVLPIEVVFDE